MKLDRRSFFASLGGAAVVASMSDEAKADALERYLMAQATRDSNGVGEQPR